MTDAEKLIGKDFSGITLLSVHGRGHTGVVYVGFQKSLKRKIAIKLVPKGKVTAQCFKDEAEVVAVLQHPNIVTVFDVGEDDEFLYIAMQLVEGRSLQTEIERAAKNPVPSKRLLQIPAILQIMAGVLDALEYAHRENVVHQDVKPGNILIETSTGRPFLVDFGIARTELTEDESKYIHGTPIYMAPEQARGEPTDARADIYAAGLVLWEALAGKLPNQTLPAIKLVGIKARKPETFFLSAPSASCPRIDGELERIILKAAACDKLARYENCARFKDDLRKYAESNFQIRI
jgi:serine/threonine-protein kinase